MEVIERNRMLLNYKLLRQRLPSNYFRTNIMYFYYGTRYSMYNWKIQPIHVTFETVDRAGERLIYLFKEMFGLTILANITVILYYDKLPPFSIDNTVIAIHTSHLSSRY